MYILLCSLRDELKNRERVKFGADPADGANNANPSIAKVGRTLSKYIFQN